MSTIPGLYLPPLADLARMTPYQRDRLAAVFYRKGRASAGARDATVDARQARAAAVATRKVNTQLAAKVREVTARALAAEAEVEALRATVATLADVDGWRVIAERREALVAEAEAFGDVRVRAS